MNRRRNVVNNITRYTRLRSRLTNQFVLREPSKYFNNVIPNGFDEDVDYTRISVQSSMILRFETDFTSISNASIEICAFKYLKY